MIEGLSGNNDSVVPTTQAGIFQTEELADPTAVAEEAIADSAYNTAPDALGSTEATSFSESKSHEENNSLRAKILVVMGRLKKFLYLPHRISISAYIIIFAIVISIVIGLIVLIVPSNRASNSFSIPILGTEISQDPHVQIKDNSSTSSSFPEDFSHDSAVKISGCDLTPTELVKSGIPDVQVALRQNPGPETTLKFFDRNKKTFQQAFPNTILIHFNECWYSSVNADNVAPTVLAVFHLHWRKIPDQKKFYYYLSQLWQTFHQHNADISWTYNFDYLSNDSDEYSCQGFLTANYYFLLLTKYPSCEPLNNVLGQIAQESSGS